MLYISRWVGYDGSVGIADTDDGVEEIVSNKCMAEAVLEDGLVVSGWGSLHHTVQPHGEKTPLQLKTKLLQFTDVDIYKGAISSIRWDIDHMRHPVTIRLSDFATSCHDFILRGNDIIDFKCMTLVFDDKLARMSLYSLAAVVWPESDIFEDVYYDLREVKDTMLALSIYRSIFSCVELPNYGDLAIQSRILESVIDIEGRCEKMARAVVPGRLWR